MRKFALIIALLLSLILAVGVKAEAVSPQERCAMWVSIMCEKLVETHEVTYVGDHDGKVWCYTPYTRQCYWTGEDSNVWSFPAVDTEQ